MRRRIRFIGRLVVSGLRWARELADHVLLLLGVLLLASGIAVGGVLLHRPAWFLGVFGAFVFLVVLGEGAYRTWDEADKRAEAAQTEHDEPASNAETAAWLSQQLAEGNALLERWTPQIRLDKEGNIVMEAAVWERLTREGLAERVPEYAGVFSVEVGLGEEFAQFLGEVRERTTLRRRIHGLHEIVKRYETGRGA